MRPGRTKYFLTSDDRLDVQENIVLGCVQQPFLLNYANYTLLQSPGDFTVGREFQVAEDCTCLGLYLKPGATSTVDIRLYRVSDQVLIGAKDGLPTVLNVLVELLFDTPIPVVSTETYRIGFTDNGIPKNARYYRYIMCDNPDGPVTILTTNCTTYSVGDAYMNFALSTVAFGGEPIICA